MRRFAREPDFEAEVTILPFEDGRHRSKRVGWRPGIQYFEDVENVWLVFPLQWVFSGRVLSEGDEIPSRATARFWILSGELRPMHRERLQVGKEFRIVEGKETVALGRVTEILNLSKVD